MIPGKTARIGKDPEKEINQKHVYMKTGKKLAGTVKELVSEKLKELAEPSERKIETARRKVNALKRELLNAEQEARLAETEWVKFKKECAARIRNNETVIGQFKRKMERSGEKFRQKYEEKIMDLERKNHRLKRRLGAYRNENMEKWLEFKSVVKKNMEEIAASFRGLTDAVLMRGR
jgi:hypothetical protein